MAVDNARLREIRDQALRYIYENGAGMPHFSVDGRALENELGLSKDESASLFMLMMNQHLLPERGIAGMVGLSDRGQAEAEALGPNVLMRDPPRSGDVTINAKYSIVQVGGAGSTQTAHLAIDQSKARSVLNEIEMALPGLNLDAPALSEASELVQSLKTNLTGAAARASAAALSSILSGAGSTLGQRLMETLMIAAS